MHVFDPHKATDMVQLPLSYLLVEALETLYARVSHSKRPADREVTAFLRQQKRIDRKERDFLAKTTYGIIRRRGLLIEASKELPFKPDPHSFVLLYLLGWTHLKPTDLPRPDDQIEPVMEAIARFRKRPPPQNPAEAIAQKHSLPLWLSAALIEAWGQEQAPKLAAALKRPPPLTLRVNTLYATRQEVRTMLSRQGVRTSPTKYSPIGLTVTGHARVMKTQAFKQGLFEIQDEGSQLIGLLAEAEPGQCVIDACAGAGGKTLHLAADMHNKGMLYAMDAYQHRLSQLKPRARRARVHNLRFHAIDKDGTKKLARLKKRADVVLIDAPCSGTGALRRNPDDAWKLQATAPTKYAAIQAEIIERYARMVRPGGRLVYATCSLLPQENQQTVEHFLKTHGDTFTPVPVAQIFDRCASQTPQFPDQSPWMRLAPHLHGTDGFFAAVFERKKPDDQPATELQNAPEDTP